MRLENLYHFWFCVHQEIWCWNLEGDIPETWKRDAKDAIDIGH